MIVVTTKHQSRANELNMQPEYLTQSKNKDCLVTLHFKYIKAVEQQHPDLVGP